VFITTEEREKAIHYFTKENKNHPLYSKYSKRINTKPKPRELISGRRSQEFFDLPVDANSDDHTKLQYIATFHCENYLLERSLLVSAEMLQHEKAYQQSHPKYITSNFPLHLGPPFHTNLFYGLTNSSIENMLTLLKASLLFPISFSVECEIFNQLFKQLKMYQELHVNLKQIVIQELAQLPPFARQALIINLSAHLRLPRSSNIQFQMTESEKRELGLFLYQHAINTTTIREPEVQDEMNDLFVYIHEMDKKPSRASRKSQSALSVRTPELKPSRFYHMDRSPIYVYDEPGQPSATFYASTREPKVGEEIHDVDNSCLIIVRLKKHGLLLAKRLPKSKNSPVVTLSRDQMMWMPANGKGYWKIASKKSKKDVTATHLPQQLKKSELTLFSQNNSWTPSFVVGSEAHIDNLNASTQGSWTKMDEHIPFQLFNTQREFVLQPGSNPYSTAFQMTERATAIVNTSPQQQQEVIYEEISPQPQQPSEESNTFLLTQLPESEDPDRTKIPQDYADLESKGSRKSSVTSGSARTMSRLSSARLSSAKSKRLSLRTPVSSPKVRRISRNRSSSPSTSQQPNISSPVSARSPSIVSKKAHRDSFMTHGVHQQQQQQQQTTQNRIVSTHGGMAVSVPNMLFNLANQNGHHSLQRMTPVQRRAQQWHVLPGQAKFVVHNPLDKHPFTKPPTKKIPSNVKKPLIKLVRGDALDKDISYHRKIPRKPFRTRFHQYQSAVRTLKERHAEEERAKRLSLTM